MDDNTAFIDAIRANPGDVSLRLVYADWLEERGDPRGEFLRLQSALADLSRKGVTSASRRVRSLQARLRDLRAAIDAEWLVLVDPQWWVAEMGSVKWNRIEHAYGRADDVAERLRTIAWGKEADASTAFGGLSNNLNHQGSIYPATGPAVPFIIEALRATQAGPQIRAGLLSLLAGIASGAGEYPASTTSDEEYYGAAGGMSLRDVFAGVWHGAPLYIRLLCGDPEADVRMQAAHLLGVLVGPGPAFVPAAVQAGFDRVVTALLDRTDAEEDGLALASVAFALGCVQPQDTRVRRTLRQLVERTGTEEATRVAAALALVEADGPRHKEVAAVDLLVDTMNRAAKTDVLFQPRIGTKQEKRWCPWVVGRLRFRLCGALCSWSAGNEGRMDRVLPALLVGVQAANGYTAESDIGPVLSWLWPGRDIRIKSGTDGKWERELPPQVTAPELTGVRRMVVEACYENGGIWRPAVGNTDLAFMRVGLPTARAELGALLGKKPARARKPSNRDRT